MKDAVSTIMSRLRMRAGIFTEASYCGTWAVDTSGQKVATFHLISDGECWLHLPGETPSRLHPGDLVFFPQDSRHLIAPTSEIPPDVVVNQPPPENPELPHTQMLCGYFEFLSRAQWPLMDSLPSVVVLGLHRTVGNQTRLLIDLILAECERQDAGHSAVLEQLSYVLLVHLIRRSLEDGEVTGLLLALSDRQIGEALNLIHREPEKSWQVESLAQAVGMSRAAFSNRFTKLVGESAMAYLTAWRMQVAIDLMSSKDLSIGAVADEVGSVSEAAFRNAFTRVIGVPPGRYRREVLLKNNGAIAV